jgi:hypothetical protein
MTTASAPAATTRNALTSSADILRHETAHTIRGVPGRLFTLRRPPAPWAAGTFANQTWVSEPRRVKGYGAGATLTVSMRFDDNCHNGSNDFTITGEVRDPGVRRDSGIVACGCLHDDTAATFPELASLIRWHLTGSRGPMHYLANTLYLAGDADHNGLRAGETRQRKTRDGLPMWELVAVNAVGVAVSTTPTGLKYQGADTVPLFILGTTHAGETPPATPTLQWRPSLTVGEGKARELDAARRAAAWPEATDEQLCLPREELRALLIERLPGLLAAFRADMESIGFMWECPAA